MSTLTVVLPFGMRFTVTPRRWLAAALWLLLALLMWGFVSVLQQGVARGNQMRAEQLRAATQPPAKAPPRVAAVKTAKHEPQ